MEPTPEQIDRWMRQAEHDFALVEALIEAGGHDAAAFYAQQAAEKALKAVYMARVRKEPRRTHDLVSLMHDLDAPQALAVGARKLTLDYQITRYPDMGDSVPAEAYTVEDARDRQAAAKAIMHWAKGAAGREG